ncbi:TraR/DksA family transcriptional regulator [Algiphilus sp.]|uniref:TraR/DksA family transcriptional regulator n=1 Tax=Algiphilus sp. TaxID=1872431 RepID=UPI003C5AEF8E
MDSPLTRSQLEAFETTLSRRLAQLRDEVRATIERSGDERAQSVADQVTDLKDTAFASMAADLDLADIERDATEIRDIDAALTRLAEGHFGICVDCGDAIPAARLNAYPSAARCVACQEQFERPHAPA